MAYASFWAPSVLCGAAIQVLVAAHRNELQQRPLLLGERLLVVRWQGALARAGAVRRAEVRAGSIGPRQQEASARAAVDLRERLQAVVRACSQEFQSRVCPAERRRAGLPLGRKAQAMERQKAARFAAALEGGKERRVGLGLSSLLRQEEFVSAEAVFAAVCGKS